MIILVTNDETHDNYWVLYRYENGMFIVDMMQQYDCRKFWNRIPYIKENYDVSQSATYEIENEYENNALS